MEAPEKIYVPTAVNELHYHMTCPNNEFQESIEYTRTDALIEKACEGIDHLLSGYIIKNFHFGDSYEIDTLIEDFKNYMKGKL